MNTASTLLQAAVRATHRWPVLGSIYRSIYTSAAEAAGELAARHAGVAGIYARNSYALGTWEPGRSDIDLTVVWIEPAAARAEAFSADYERLKQRFPMLGEVEMIDALHLPAWSQYGVSGLESARWKRLGGSHVHRCRYEGVERLDRVRHAVSIYCHQFLPKFWQEPRDEKTLQRMAAKIRRQLGLCVRDGADAAGLMKDCLRELAHAIRELPGDAGGSQVDYATVLGTPVSAASLPPRSNGAREAGVESVLSYGPASAARHVVVREEFAITAIASRFPGASVMNEDVFRFYLTSVDPLEYFTLLRNRAILEGEDPLRVPFPMAGQALRETVCHYAVDLLTFPYRPGLDALPEKQFRDLLYGWFLRTLKYFEDGRVTFDYHLLREHFGRRYEEGEPRFALMHGIAGAVSQRMLAG